MFFNMKTESRNWADKNRKRVLFLVLKVILVSCVIVYTSTIKTTYSVEYVNKTIVYKHDRNPRYVCLDCIGGIGNQMFQFASAYGIARRKQMKVVLPKYCKILDIFKLDVIIATDLSFCKGFQTIKEINNAVYTPRLLEFDGNYSVKLVGFLQVYRYFDLFSSDLRKQFSFKDEIKFKADGVLKDVHLKTNMTCLHTISVGKYHPDNNNYKECYKFGSNERVTVVGIHVRRGDWLIPPCPENGFQTASKTYLQMAVEWYKKRYRHLFFILATNDMTWTKENMPGNISIVFLEGNNAEIDMAILSSCDHFIATTGTFSWWIGWLIGGSVTYYKWPAKENTSFRKTFGKDYTDHFYPSWYGL